MSVTQKCTCNSHGGTSHEPRCPLYTEPQRYYRIDLDSIYVLGTSAQAGKAVEAIRKIPGMGGTGMSHAMTSDQLPQGCAAPKTFRASTVRVKVLSMLEQHKRGVLR